ncbi:MAG: 2-isopropylmalate synthase, partial [Spirochaetes bacterium]
DLHLAKKLKKSHKEVLEDVKRYVSYARNLCEDVEFSAEDATRSNLDYLCQVVKIAIKEGASTINIPDTVGYTVPKEFFQIISTLKQRVEGIDSIVLSVHCHNDLGLAVANSLSAIEAGARQVECTINGIGERAGNASLEEIVMAIRTRKDYFSFTTNINTEQIYPTSRLVSMITGIPVQPNKAIVGDNAFAHEAGIHQDGILKEKQTYEIMTPESIGIKKSKLVLGKHSGRHALKEKLKDMGYDLSQKELDIAFASFKKLADKKKDVYDEDLESILLNEVYKIPDKYKLLNVNVACGTITIPTATVQMEVDGKILKEAGFGDGPVDATYKTIKKITNSKDNLVRFSVAAITKGTEAQGEVSIRIQEGKFTATGQGTDTDVIVASAKAYVDALNKLHYRKNKKEMLKSNI